MLVVLSKALAFVLIILIGYICKRRGFFSPTDYQVVSKIVLNITLPCAVINSFAHFEMDYSLIAAVFLGLFGNLLMLFVSLMLTRGDTPATKIFYIFSLAGYNVGCFTLPFAQAFLTPFAVVGLCMFDVGNSIMCTGMTYALTASCIGYADGRKDKFSMKNITQKLLHSVPFVVYISMLVLSLLMILLAALDVKLPSAVFTLTRPAGQANAFIAMMMIGMMFEIKLDKKAMGYVKELFSVRYAISLLCAAAFLYLAPFKQEINYVIALAFMAPCTIIGPIFVEKLGANVQLASLFNSLTIITSVILFTAFFIIING